MTKITICFAKLPIEQIKTSLQQHIAPLLKRMPDVRLARIAERILLGILGGQSPIVTCMARQSSKDEGETWAAAKKIYRWLENERFDSQNLSVSRTKLVKGVRGAAGVPGCGGCPGQLRETVCQRGS